MPHPLPPLRDRSVGVVVGGFAHEGQMNGPGEPRNVWAGAESMGRAEASGLAADTWERFGEVVDLVVRVGADHVVTTLEWARISPRRGQLDDSALGRYADFFDALRAEGVHPIVRLGSSLVPDWAGEEFWLMPGSPERFVASLMEAVGALGVNSVSWISVSNAIASTIAGWLSGEAPPFRRFATSDARLVLDNFLTAHVLLAGELHQCGVRKLGLEVPLLGYECAEAVGVGLSAARAGDHVSQAVAASRPNRGSGLDLLSVLNPLGVSGPLPPSVSPLVVKMLRREGGGRWAVEAERLGAEICETDIALWLTNSVSPRLSLSKGISLAKRQPTDTPPGPLPLEQSEARWFVDEVVATSRNGIVTSEPLPGGVPQYLHERAGQLSAISGPVRYTYNALLDGYVDGTFSVRTGLFGVDRARGTRGLRWLETDSCGDDAASAFRHLAETVRAGIPT